MKLKKIMAVLLSSLMVLSAAPADVFAIDDLSALTDSSGENVAEAEEETEAEDIGGFSDEEDFTSEFSDGESTDPVEDFTSVQAAGNVVASGKVNEAITWSVNNNGVLLIEGTGDMPDYSGQTVDGVQKTTAPWADWTQLITEITIGSGITGIGNNAFFGCLRVTKVHISDSVTYIGNYAFRNCTILTGITLPEGLTRIGNTAFGYCESLTSIKLPENAVLIGDAAFICCYNLTDVSFPEKLGRIPPKIFAGCRSLVSIKIPDRVTTFGSFAFQGCTSLTDINFPEKLVSIGMRTFSGCGMESIVLPDTVTMIDGYAFAYMKNLKEITIPKSVSNLSNHTFDNCTSLSIIKFTGTEAQWNNYGLTADDINHATVYCNYDPNHMHDYVAQIVTAATCTEDGKQKMTCKICGDTYEEVIPAQGHNWNEGKIIKEATCTEDGEREFTCTRCQKTRIEKIEATGHVEMTDVAVEPTCEIPGRTEGKHCSVCNVVLKEAKEIPALGHNWDNGKIIKEATCTEEGEKEFTCTRCQKTRTEKITTTGHEEVIDAAVEPTCEIPGKTEGSHCSVCNKVLKEAVEIPALGHNWDNGKTVKEATCTEDGEREFTCTRCQKIRTEKIEATGHVEVTDAAVEPTCEIPGKTEGKHCSVCNKVLQEAKEIPALGHSWDEGKIIKEATCTEVGEKEFTCTRCQKTRTERIESTGHKEVIDAAVEPTCETSGKTEGSHCENCGEILRAQEEIPATGHVEVKDEAVEPTCEIPGKTEGSHCRTCGKILKAQEEIPATGHTEVSVTTKNPTCEEPGNEMVYCSTCNRILTAEKEIPALGHKETVDAAVAATCEKTGKSEGSHCSVCGKVLKEQQVIPAKGHKFTKWTTKTAATVFKPAVQTRTCSTCKKTETRNYGKKLTPYMKTSVTSLLLKTKQKTTVLKVSGLKKGDSIVSWKSSNTKIVTVSGKKNGTSIVTAGTRKGNATIIITLKSGYKKTVKVTVQPTTVKTTKISGIPGSLTLKKGQTKILKPVLTPVTSQEKVTYASSKKSVAVVTSSGKITAKGKGTAVITVKSGKKMVKCKVTVK